MKIIFVSDVDGCLTDGGMYYNSSGKVMKRFSAGDHEGLKLLQKHGIDVLFITADKVGLPITSKRIKDMSNSKLKVVSEIDRKEFFKTLKNTYDYIAFLGDGLGDAAVKMHDLCDYFICPSQSHNKVKYRADLVIANEGGHGALLEAAIDFIDYAYRKRLIKEILDLYE